MSYSLLTLHFSISILTDVMYCSIVWYILFVHTRTYTSIHPPQFNTNLVGWLVVTPLGKNVFSKAIWCRRGFPVTLSGHFYTCHNNFVAICDNPNGKRVSSHTVVCAKHIECLYFHCRLRLIGLRSSGTHSRSANPFHNCTAAVLEVHHNSRIQLFVAHIKHSVHLRLRY